MVRHFRQHNLKAMYIRDTLILLSALLGTTLAVPNFNDCTKLVVKDLNDHLDSCSNDRLTADCLSKMNAEGLGHACLEKLHDKTLEEMHGKTVKELTKGPKENIPKTVKFMRAFLNKHKEWEADKGKEIAKWIAGDETFLEKLISDATFPKNLVANVLTVDTVPLLKPNTCAKFNEEMARTLNADDFKGITPDCFAAIQPSFFKGIDAEFFKNINPKAFVAITPNQVKEILEKDVVKMTKEQAEHWGVPPKMPAIEPNATDAIKTEQAAARQKYREGHPCFSAKKWINSTPDEARRALLKHCHEVLSAATTLNVSSGLSLMFAAIAGLVFLV